MRLLAIAAVTPLPEFALTPANAEVPTAITAVLAPGVGYLLAQSDLCKWGLAEKMRRLTELTSRLLA